MAPIDVLPPPPVMIKTDLPETARPARVSFRKPVEKVGYIDGGWWPYSSDLAAELPALLHVLWSSGRDIVHISYNLDHWDVSPRRLRIDGRRVRLAGFHGQNPLTVFVSDSRHTDTAELLLISSDTEPSVAKRALELACASGGTDRAEAMFDQARVGAA